MIGGFFVPGICGECSTAFASRLTSTEKQKQKIAAFGSSYTMSASSSALDLDPPATSEG
jgi:hypothetical protein